MRAAVVIGVDRTGDLPQLSGAAADAKRVAEWLEGEGYETTLLTDTMDGVIGSGRVTTEEVKKAVAAYVSGSKAGSKNGEKIQQLVMYFAGHGLNNFDTEIWLLTNAPADSDEAIDLARNIDLARDCGIGNVIFVSDACRSNPPAGPLRRVRGSAVFPNSPQRLGARGKVDRLLPTVPNAAAYEVNETIQDVIARGGIFTTELLRAHGFPKGAAPASPNADSELVRVLPLAGANVRVVDLALLAAHLETRVPVAAKERRIVWPQQPECIVEAPPRDKFIGRALFSIPTGKVTTVNPRGASAESPEATAIKLRAQRQAALGEQIERTRSNIVHADQTDHFETQTGIQVTGDIVDWAVGMGAVVPRSHPPFNLVQLNPQRSAGSVLVARFNQFERI
jgi:hypothetical protein